MRQNMRLRIVGILALLGGVALAEAQPALGAGGLPANADPASSEKPRQDTDAADDGSLADLTPDSVSPDQQSSRQDGSSSRTTPRAGSTTEALGASGTFEILPASTVGQCLDVEWGSLSFAYVQQYTCHGGAMQSWQLRYLGSGEYEIRAMHSGLCLDVYLASRIDGAQIVQHPCNGGANQRFRINADPSGTYEIRAVHSDKCLDVPYGTSTPGVRIQQYRCHGGAMQRYYFQPR